ncbi:MAG: GspE/PulE family protein [Phycisphaerales bacterium]
MHFILAADYYLLVNPITPILGLLVLLGWGWLVSTKLDKDAQYFHFARNSWNTAHLIAGAVGLAVMFAPIPEPWYIAAGLVGGTVVMMSTTLAYWWYRNRNVPEDQKFYLSLESIRNAMQRRAAAKASRAATLSLVDAKGAERVPPMREDPLYPVHIAMEEVMAPALVARATTIEMAPTRSGQYQISQVVDGIRYKREPVEATMGAAIIDYLKGAAGLDVADKRRKQRGDFTLKVGSATRHSVRVRSAGSSAGQTLVMEVDLKQRVNRKPADLGLLPKQSEALKALVDDPHGVVLVAAPADQGRTTTLYALLRNHDAFTTNIRTLELEHLVQIDGVGHTEFDPAKDDASFDITLRSMLRRDPNIVMVSDLISNEAAREAAAPGIEGPLIYVGLRAESSLEALAVWVKAVGDMPKAAAPLRLVLFQKLVRRLCDNCKIAYRPPADQLKKLGLPPDQVKQLFKPSGKIMDRNREETCPSCGGLGYVGQTGVFEIFPLDNEARSAAAKGDLNALKQHMRRAGVISLQQAALRKAIEGATSIEEVIRVTRTKSSSSSGKSSRPQSPAGAPAEAGA